MIGGDFVHGDCGHNIFWKAMEYKSILSLGLGFKAHAFFHPKP